MTTSAVATADLFQAGRRVTVVVLFDSGDTAQVLHAQLSPLL